ncbi:Uncharacterised protein [Comamonas aquatica]|nr:Uncharacterised protein [Comamonas aquatica]
MKLTFPERIINPINEKFLYIHPKLQISFVYFFYHIISM